MKRDTHPHRIATTWRPLAAPEAPQPDDVAAPAASDIDAAFLAFRRGVERVAYTGAAADAMRAGLLQLLSDLDAAQVRAARMAQPTVREPQRATPKASAAKPARRRRFLTPEQLVERWEGAVVLGTLANWRSKSTPEKPRGPAFQKFGSNVRYAMEDVEEYERHHAVGPEWKEGAEGGWAARAH